MFPSDKTLPGLVLEPMGLGVSCSPQAQDECLLVLRPVPSQTGRRPPCHSGPAPQRGTTAPSQIPVPGGPLGMGEGPREELWQEGKRGAQGRMRGSGAQHLGGAPTHLLGGGGHALLHHDEGAGDVLFLHPLAVHLDRLDADLGLLCGQNARRSALPGPLSPCGPGSLALSGTRALALLCRGAPVPLRNGPFSLRPQLPHTHDRNLAAGSRTRGLAASTSPGELKGAWQPGLTGPLPGSRI